MIMLDHKQHDGKGATISVKQDGFSIKIGIRSPHSDEEIYEPTPAGARGLAEILMLAADNAEQSIK